MLYYIYICMCVYSRFPVKNWSKFLGVSIWFSDSFLYIHIYMYMCIYICIYIRLYSCTCISKYVCVVFICSYMIYVNTKLYVYMYNFVVCVFICVPYDKSETVIPNPKGASSSLALRTRACQESHVMQLLGLKFNPLKNLKNMNWLWL